MHIPTHILSGWVSGNTVNLSPRERLFCMIAAAAPDVDGIGIIFGEKVYWDYHHQLGHNLFFGLFASAVLATLSKRKIKTFILYLLLFHLHLVMDYYGSGPGWPIHYLWPTHALILKNHDAWEFSSWQNTLAFVMLLLITLAIAFYKKRTPLELITPRLDQKIISKLT